LAAIVLCKARSDKEKTMSFENRKCRILPVQHINQRSLVAIHSSDSAGISRFAPDLDFFWVRIDFLKK